MKFPAYLQQLLKAGKSANGHGLSQLLRRDGPKADQLLSGLGDADQYNLAGPSSMIQVPWGAVGLEHAMVLLAQRDGKWKEAYKRQNVIVNSLLRFALSTSAWILEALYTTLRDLRYFAEQADDEETDQSAGSMLEDCARTMNKAFTTCATDRSNSGAQSRRQGVYKMAGLSIKSYFKVNKPTLCKNIIRAISSDAAIPPLESYGMADQVTWRFYIGMLAFQSGDEDKADAELTWAFDHCHCQSPRNQELILNYLIPLRILAGKFPSSRLLHRFPRLEETYQPFLQAIRDGNLRAYDDALERSQRRLVSMNTWMTVEKAREVCLRGLYRIVWLASDRSTRIPVEAFRKAMRLQGVDCDAEEVECMVANMIYKGYIKGYISHEKQTVVLSKAGAFPPIAARRKTEV